MKEAFLAFLEKEKDKLSFNGGVFLSFVLHLVLFLVAFIALERTKDNAAQASQVFTVTLEGGQNLGGIAQVPKKGKEKLKVGSKKESKAKVDVKEVKLKKEQEAKKASKKELEFKKKQAKKKAEKKKAELKKAKLKKEKLKKEKLKKAKLKKKADKKKLEAAKKRKAEREVVEKRKAREKRLAEIAKKVRSNVYNGESTNVGGQGFGAAKLGGNGFGGGTLASAEKVAYANSLQQHVKSGWRWLAAREKLRCSVLVDILPDGRIRSVNISQSSGNSNFDESVLRAVRKANPVPAAPVGIYQDFKQVRFWFDSSESS